jgi:hypothetical protein
MKHIYWNIRGIANSPSKIALKRLLKAYKRDFCYISEPWMNFNNFPSNWFSRLNFKLFAVNKRNDLLPNIWCCCSSHIEPVIIHADDQQISFTVSDSGIEVGFSVVYASTDYVKRRLLWHSLRMVHNSLLLPWLCIGDFNTTLGSHEVRSNHVPAKLPMDEFAAWSDSINLLHLPTKGT